LDLTTIYTDQEKIDVSIEDNVYVCQEATGKYCIHQFQDYVDDESNCKFTSVLKCSLAPSISTVYLQIYNNVSMLWETIDSNNSASADTNFILTATIYDIAPYKDASKMCACRIYQLIV